MSKTAVGELISLSLISGTEKVRMRDWGGGECQDFSSEISCLTVPKISWGNHSMLCFRKFPVAKMILDQGVGEV